MKKNLLTFFILFIFFLMFALTSVTKQAASEGLQLWIFTVLPALLPYTIISSLLLYLDAFRFPCRALEKILKRKLPENEILIVVCGYMCGCPIGAKLASDLYKKEKITRNTAELLMCACNNLSPSFLINYVFVMVYAPFVQLTSFKKWALFIIIILSSLLGALVTHCLYKKSQNSNLSIHNYNQSAVIQNYKFEPNTLTQKKPSISKFFEDCILSAFEIQAKIGGYIILFTIVANLFLYTLNIPEIHAAILGSILEVTSGLELFLSCNNDVAPLTSSLVPSLITALTSFGGICTIFQTKTAISGSGLSIKKYGLSKLMSGCLAFILSMLLIR